MNCLHKEYFDLVDHNKKMIRDLHDACHVIDEEKRLMLKTWQVNKSMWWKKKKTDFFTFMEEN